jgi:ketosteroid isomerase-like protein
MSDSSTREVIRKMYDLLSSRAEPEAIAHLFSDDAILDVPGATELVPWIGERQGRKAIANFVRDLREYIEPISFEVTSTVVEGEKAMTVGQLESRVKSTGKIIETAFATEFTVKSGKIAYYRFFEDSYAVAEAVRETRK